jgi:hypothetical protein
MVPAVGMKRYLIIGVGAEWRGGLRPAPRS